MVKTTWTPEKLHKCEATTAAHNTASVTLVMPRTMSMEVVNGLTEPTSLQPTTGGSQRDTGWPNITASHSIPPTPAGGSRVRVRKSGRVRE